MVVAPLRSNNRLTVEYVTSTTNAGSWLAYFVGLDASKLRFLIKNISFKTCLIISIYIYFENFCYS